MADIIYFYSPADEELARKLILHLKTRARLRQFKIWSLEPGEGEAEARFYINGGQRKGETIEGAQIILLFHSVNFVNDLTNPNELIAEVIPDIMQRHKRGLARVIPISLGFADVKGALYEELDLLEHRKKPVSHWERNNEADEACSSVVDKITDEMQDIKVYRIPKEALKTLNFLTYFCDRTSQTNQLRNILPFQRKISACIVHGHTDEELENYKIRLEKSEIGKILKSKNKPVWLIDIGAPTDAIDIENPANYLEKILSGKVSKGEDIDLKMPEILKRLESYKAPVMICYNLSTENLRRYSPKKSIFSFLSWGRSLPPAFDMNPQAIESFFEFWNNTALFFQNDAAALNTTPIIVSLFFKYNEQMPGDNALNENAGAYFNAFNFGAYQNLSGAVLNKIPPVAYGDLVNWIADETVFSNFCRNHPGRFCDEGADSLLSAATDLYNNPLTPRRIVEIVGNAPQVKIRMRTLRPFLVEQLGKDSCADRLLIGEN